MVPYLVVWSCSVAVAGGECECLDVCLDEVTLQLRCGVLWR